ncbi:TetR/AcrR family transcriptional regulator [Verticiella sediminum]|uniref:TetR/AcrR family transcriptional regulator n=1 Tax=Verticiella sediminum TaxID=1247510 RepID=A0A556AWM8_9BURK|nr:TetR/AcrR family transcriptional regulator [Verticiella sediminum]TSH97334.1 TetR/AcrR family transcriptional regulator [Verticiella sediminum]
MPAQEREREETGAVIPEHMAARLDPVVLAMFASTDFHGVDMRSIAREAAMSFATIYRYFQNKEKLLFWFIARWLQPLNEAAQRAIETSKPLRERLLDRLEVHLRFYEANPQVGRIIFLTVPLQRWMQDETFAYGEPVKSLLAAISAGQESGELRKDVPAVTIFDAYMAMFNRTFLMWEYRGRKTSLLSQRDHIFHILWDGIKAPG